MGNMVKSSEVMDYVAIVHAAMSTLNKKLQLQKTQMKKRAQSAQASKRMPSQRGGNSKIGRKQGYRNGNNRINLGTGASGSNFATNRRQQIVEEDEYIGEINGSTAFANTAYAVNPGQSITFPWGNKIASLYNEYEFQYLEFYYKREVSEFSTNGQAGKVILSFNYDATDSPPVTKQQVEDTLSKVDGMPCTPVLRLPVSAIIMKKNDAKYVRPGPQIANTDLKTYDVGVLNVSTYGNTNSSVIGELHVRYKCILRVPILDPSQQVGGVVHFSSLAPTSANCLAAMVQQAGATTSLSSITVSGNTITFPSGIPGNYLTYLTCTPATSCGAIVYGSVTGGVSLNPYFCNSAARNGFGNLASVASTAGLSTFNSNAISVTSAGGTLVLTPGTIVGSAGSDLFIISLPSTVLTLNNSSNVEIQLEVQNLKSQIHDLRKYFSESHLNQNQISDDDFEPEKLIRCNEEKKCAEIDSSQYISRSVVKALLGK